MLLCKLSTLTAASVTPVPVTPMPVTVLIMLAVAAFACCCIPIHGNLTKPHHQHCTPFTLYLCRSHSSGVSVSESSQHVLLCLSHSDHLRRLMKEPLLTGLFLFCLNEVHQPTLVIAGELMQTVGRGHSLYMQNVIIDRQKTSSHQKILRPHALLKHP